MKKLLLSAALVAATISHAYAGSLALLGAGKAAVSCTYVAPSHVQSGSNTGTATTLAVTLASTVGNGNALALSLFYQTSAKLVSFVDDKGDAMPYVASFNNGAGFTTATYYFPNVTNAPKTFTATFSSAPSFDYVTVDEYANISTGSLDTFTVPVNVNPGTSPNEITSGAAPALTNNDLIWGVIYGNSTVPTSGTGFATRISDSSNWVLTEDLIQATGGPVAATGQTASDGGTVAMMAMKAACPQAVQPYTFYVDSVNGSDSNTGKSPAQAYQNITKLPALTNGETVALADGSYWRQELRATASNLIVVAYGSGARPILDGSDQISNASLTKTSGFTNVYNTATLTFLDGGNLGWINLFETGGPGDSQTGSYLTEVSSEALVDSTACSYYVPGMVADSALPSSAIIYLHSCDGTSPITNGYTYEFSNRATGLYMQGTNNAAIGIETRKSSDNDGSLQCQTDGGQCTYNSVLARLGGKHNAFAPCGSLVENSIFINANYPLAGNLLVIFDNTGTGKNYTVYNNVFQQDQNVDGGTAILSHAGSGSCGQANFTNNWYLAKNGSTLSGEAVQNASLVVSTANVGSELSSFSNPQTNVQLVNDQGVSSVTNNTPIDIVGASNVSVSVTGSKFCGNNIQNGFVFPGVAGTTITLSNDLFYAQTSVSAGIAGGFASTVSVNGSDFGTSATQMFYYNLFATSGSTFTGNNNIYESIASPIWTLNNTTETTLANWRTLTGQEAASTTSGGNAISACTLPTLPVVN